jgi:hypothetical protein
VNFSGHLPLLLVHWQRLKHCTSGLLLLCKTLSLRASINSFQASCRPLLLLLLLLYQALPPPTPQSATFFFTSCLRAATAVADAAAVNNCTAVV